MRKNIAVSEPKALFAQLFVSRIEFTDLEVARRTLAAHNAFNDPADDVKLILPFVSDGASR